MKITFEDSLDEIIEYWLGRYRIVKKNRSSSDRFKKDLAIFLFRALTEPSNKIHKDFSIDIVKNTFTNIKFIYGDLNFCYAPPLEIHLYKCDNRLLVPLALHEVGHSFQYRENRIFVPNEEGTGPHIMWQELDAWNFAWKFLKEKGVLDEEFKKIIFLSILSYLINFLYLTKYDSLDLIRDIKKYKFILDDKFQPYEFEYDFIDFVKVISRQIDTDIEIWDYPSFINLVKKKNETVSIFGHNRII